MPIRPENKDKYPKNWKQLSTGLKEEAGWRCESCFAKHGEPHPETGSIVILTTAHLDHNPANCARENLRVWCQKCHNTYDAPHRAAGVKARRREAENKTQEDLFK